MGKKIDLDNIYLFVTFLYIYFFSSFFLIFFFFLRCDLRISLCFVRWIFVSICFLPSLFCFLTKVLQFWYKEYIFFLNLISFILFTYSYFFLQFLSRVIRSFLSCLFFIIYCIFLFTKPFLYFFQSFLIRSVNHLFVCLFVCLRWFCVFFFHIFSLLSFLFVFFFNILIIILYTIHLALDNYIVVYLFIYIFFLQVWWIRKENKNNIKIACYFPINLILM